MFQTGKVFLALGIYFNMLARCLSLFHLKTKADFLLVFLLLLSSGLQFSRIHCSDLLFSWPFFPVVFSLFSSSCAEVSDKGEMLKVTQAPFSIGSV